jgi:hypothetical protein
MNRYAAVHAVACLFHQNAPKELAELLMPGRHPDYLAEWTYRFARGIGVAVGKMDEKTFRRFVDLAIERHGEHGLLRHPDERDDHDNVQRSPDGQCDEDF